VPFEQTIPTTTHGRYLVEPAAANAAAPLLVGFHGYAEQAAIQLERLRGIPGAHAWTLVSIQALHRFYKRRSESVVASWMTREDRALMIQDNVRYVDAVLEALTRERPSRSTVVFAGFSQGVGMAYRAAALGRTGAAGVMALGGDVPPDLEPAALAKIRAVFIARGTRDPFYTAAHAGADHDRLVNAGADVSRTDVEAAHEWTPEVSEAAGRWLTRFA
jgi:predicted esterase